ncbi:MAG: MBL fold metallo-hydrolase [Bacteroidales bacterium]|nr:MBL fold metallo-hydrolase [Bacteroidales bacterium]
MRLAGIETGNFKLDGGAMFGVVPKSLWQMVYPADENNMCNLSLRALFIEDENRKILIDAGLGRKQNEKFFGYYYLNGNDSLDKSLSKEGISKSDITDVILTHLHFDHCGGAVEYDQNKKAFQATFPGATYWCSNDQWNWAMNPNLREKPSYLKENMLPLHESGQLKPFKHDFDLTPNVRIRLYNGHSQGMAVPFIRYQGRIIVYVSDLIPTSAHIPLSWICGYDTQPLLSLKEKEKFLDEAFRNNYILFFEHDLNTVCCTLQETEKGIRMKDSAGNIHELLL